MGKKDLIENNVVKRDHYSKISGESIYVGDYPSDGVLTGRLLRSKYPKAVILGVKLPKLPEGYFYVDSSDVPGNNYLVYSKEDSPVFCENTAEYIGDTIGMIVGPDETEVERLVKECEVDYEALVTVDGRVSKEYCRIVCMNLLSDFLQETAGL